MQIIAKVDDLMYTSEDQVFNRLQGQQLAMAPNK